MHRAPDARFSVARVAPLVISLVASAAAPASTSAQQLTFAVSIVTWDSAALAAQQTAYEPVAQQRELLFCIDAWRRVAAGDGVVLYAVLHTRRAAVGEAHRVPDVGSLCRMPDGRAMPMLHTHSDGNCQFSPADLATLAARGAPFDGVQCGTRYFIWESAWQVNAIANELERERSSTRNRERP